MTKLDSKTSDFVTALIDRMSTNLLCEAQQLPINERTHFLAECASNLLTLLNGAARANTSIPEWQLRITEIGAEVVWDVTERVALGLDIDPVDVYQPMQLHFMTDAQPN